MVIEGYKNLALRQGDWVMIPPSKGEKVQQTTGMEMGRSDVYQLYHLKDDIGQKVNEAEEHPERLGEMKKELEEISCREFY